MHGAENSNNVRMSTSVNQVSVSRASTQHRHKQLLIPHSIKQTSRVNTEKSTTQHLASQTQHELLLQQLCSLNQLLYRITHPTRTALSSRLVWLHMANRCNAGNGRKRRFLWYSVKLLFKVMSSENSLQLVLHKMTRFTADLYTTVFKSLSLTNGWMDG